MAEFRRLPTQQELQQMLFMQGLQPQSNADILAQNLQSQTIKPIPENIFQKIAGGAKTAGEFVNRTGTAADVAKLFPGYTGQSQVNIPTGFNFAPKQDPMGGVIPQGLQTQQVNVGQLLKAIKPADVLGITGAQQAYTDIGMGKAPKPLDVVDVAGLGAVGMAGTKGLLKATKGLPVGMSIQETKGLLQTAPKSDIGFYSAVEQAAMASPRKQATGQAFLNDIMKGQDVRADEIKWMGLDDFLKGKQNVTKQEVQDFIANNRVDVQEVRSTIPKLPGEEMPGDEGAFLPRFNRSDLVLPGGENYRELLLTMPSNMSQYNKYAASLRAKYGESGFSNLPLTEIEQARLNKFYENEDLPSYESSHFPGQPNILAHLRVNDRVDADGKKMLLIEEVQSDWHQTGRDKGYAKNVKAEIDAIQKQMNDLASQRDPVTNVMTNEKQWFDLAKQKDELIKQSKGVPDAPMKDTWYQLALKRAIQVAAEQGYDRIGLTTGARQAERFNLSKQVDELNYKKNPDKTYQISAKSGRRRNMIGDAIPENKLADYVGKDVAKKIIDNAGNDVNFGGPGTVFQPKDIWKELSGIDLKVGGEGMKKYYDEIYPKFLDKYGKKWGAKVGETTVQADGAEPIRYIDITPEMKAGVSKGQPLFMVAPVGAGLLGAQQDQRK